MGLCDILTVTQRFRHSVITGVAGRPFGVENLFNRERRATVVLHFPANTYTYCPIPYLTSLRYSTTTTCILSGLWVVTKKSYCRKLAVCCRLALLNRHMDLVDQDRVLMPLPVSRKARTCRGTNVAYPKQVFTAGSIIIIYSKRNQGSTGNGRYLRLPLHRALSEDDESCCSLQPRASRRSWAVFHYFRVNI